MASNKHKSQITATAILAIVLASAVLIAPKDVDESLIINPTNRGNLVLVDRVREGFSLAEEKYKKDKAVDKEIKREGKVRKEKKSFEIDGYKYIEEKTFDEDNFLVLVNGDTLDLSLKSITYKKEKL